MKNSVKNYGIHFFMLIMLFFSMSSCQKNENHLINPEVSKEEILLQSPVVILDQFDKYGISHNAFLDFLAGHQDFNTMSREDLLSYSAQYSDADFTGISTSWNDHEENMEIVYDLIENPANAINTLLSNNLIDSSEIELATMINELLNDAFDESTETYQSIAQFRESVSSIEDYITLNYTLVYDDSTKVGNISAKYLATCSIAKASYGYWLNAESDSNHPWHTRFNSRKTYEFDGTNFSDISNRGVFGRIARAIKVGAADVWGFVAADGCGNASSQGGYNLNCAWNNAGEKSEDAGDRHDRKYGGN